MIALSQDNVILHKSFQFAVKIVNVYKYLNEKKEYVISKQLLRCGTSIGANVNEAQAGQSRKDFISKISIASKEARETKYWITLLIETKYLPKSNNRTKILLDEIDEIIKILTSIVKSSQEV